MPSAQPPARTAPALPRPGRRFRARRWILAGVALLIVLAGFESGIRQVAPDAVRVSAYTRDVGIPFATRTITDARTVADLYTRINGLPTVWYSAINQCRMPPPPSAVNYHFDFMRAGVLIEAAGTVEQGCSVWDVVRGGIPIAHDDPDRQTRVILAEAGIP